MKKFKMIQVNEVRKVTDSVTCDICKRTFTKWNWDDGNYSALETEVRMRTGYAFPDGSGGGKDFTFDVCPACFEEKLIPALKELGAEPTISDW